LRIPAILTRRPLARAPPNRASAAAPNPRTGQWRARPASSG
jgi:hypothetical protein